MPLRPRYRELVTAWLAAVAAAGVAYEIYIARHGKRVLIRGTRGGRSDADLQAQVHLLLRGWIIRAGVGWNDVESLRDDGAMRDTELYRHLLGLVASWEVIRVELSVDGGRVDVWVQHPKRTREHLDKADDTIVFERSQLMKYLTGAVDTVRKQENRALVAAGDKRLSGTKYLWLYSAENLSERHQDRFAILRVGADVVLRPPGEQGQRGNLPLGYPDDRRVRSRLSHNREHLKTAIWFHLGGSSSTPSPAT